MQQPKVDPVEVSRLWHEGKKLREIAAVFDVSEAAICKWCGLMGLRRNLAKQRRVR
ncbi:hypothetical protein [Hoeflea sp.]|uniref:hypothetical protein n=1 Tax=Hoeflea sp. TaxID=1940281 RepID=UPI0019956B51|nr:hypothetical protein [Hoeflea sp.]MBC7282613.1 hypothetical protein [Hoeflea sp.]